MIDRMEKKILNCKVCSGLFMWEEEWIYLTHYGLHTEDNIIIYLFRYNGKNYIDRSIWVWIWNDTLHENVREEHYAMLNVEEECKNVTLREWRME